MGPGPTSAKDADFPPALASLLAQLLKIEITRLPWRSPGTVLMVLLVIAGVDAGVGSCLSVAPADVSFGQGHI